MSELIADPENKDKSALMVRADEAAMVPSQNLGQRWQEAEEEGFDLRHFWRVIMRRKWIVVLFFLMVLAVTWVHTSLSVPVYQSSLTMELEYGAPQALSVGQGAQVMPWLRGGRRAFLETQYRLLQSRPVAERVVDRLKLADRASFVAPDEGGWKSKVFAPMLAWLQGGIANPSSSQQLDSEVRFNIAVARVLSGFKVNAIAKSNLVSLRFRHADRDLAPKILDAMAQAFIEQRLEHETGASVTVKKRLLERRVIMRQQLEDSEKRLVNFARKHGIVNIDSRQTLDAERLALMSNALLEVEKQRIELGAKYRSLAKGGEGHSAILDSLVIQQLKERRGGLEAEYQKMRKIFKPAYPKMQQFLGQIAEVQQQIASEVEIIVASYKASYESIRQQEGVLAQRVEELKREVMSLADFRTQQNVLHRDVDTNKELYNSLVQRIKELAVAEVGGTDNNITVVDQATAAHQISPNLAGNLQKALILGLLGGIGLALLLERLDDTFKSAEDVERDLRVPVLGVVPKVKEIKSQTGPLGLYSAKDKKSAFAEAFRSARTALLFSTTTGAPKVLHITSAGPGEGKTTSAANLAITFTQTGSSVLLVDADMRKPSLHKLFELDQERGLANYLAGGLKPEEVSQTTQIPRLFAIPSGMSPPNPAELLSSARMIELITLAATKFDYVILDGPPVLGLADALILANMAERTILVIEMAVTRGKYIKGALRRLESARANIVGCFLSKVSKADGAYGYYDSYHYYYYYQDKSKGKGMQKT